jgi:hypothetical protein
MKITYFPTHYKLNKYLTTSTTSFPDDDAGDWISTPPIACRYSNSTVYAPALPSPTA